MENVDKKRVFIALILGIGVLGMGGWWAKDKLSALLEQKQAMESVGVQESGSVAGLEKDRLVLEEQKKDLQKRIDEIKKDVSELKPEDIKKQAPVEKILSDLEEVKKKASESAEIFDIKGNICEEVKRRFCQ